jgi:hypothetical protein
LEQNLNAMMSNILVQREYQWLPFMCFSSSTCILVAVIFRVKYILTSNLH